MTPSCPLGAFQQWLCLAEASHSEVHPQHILAGEGPLAGRAGHGQGALLLTQAGSA